MQDRESEVIDTPKLSEDGAQALTVIEEDAPTPIEDNEEIMSFGKLEEVKLEERVTSEKMAENDINQGKSNIFI